MPGSGGLEVLSAAQAESVRTVIIVITAASTMSNAVEAIKRGAHDYLTKPFHNLDLVAAAVERAVELGAQTAEINRLKTRSAITWSAGRSSAAAPRCRRSTSSSGGW